MIPGIILSCIFLACPLTLAIMAAHEAGFSAVVVVMGVWATGVAFQVEVSKLLKHLEDGGEDS